MEASTEKVCLTVWRTYCYGTDFKATASVSVRLVSILASTSDINYKVFMAQFFHVHSKQRHQSNRIIIGSIPSISSFNPQQP